MPLRPREEEVRQEGAMTHDWRTLPTEGRGRVAEPRLELDRSPTRRGRRAPRMRQPVAKAPKRRQTPKSAVQPRRPVSLPRDRSHDVASLRTQMVKSRCVLTNRRKLRTIWSGLPPRPLREWRTQPLGNPRISKRRATQSRPRRRGSPGQSRHSLPNNRGQRLRTLISPDRLFW